MKKLNLSFCENLIDSDFFLVSQNINGNSKSIEKITKLENLNLISLELLNLYKELKQLIRFIIFLKLTKKKNKLILGFKEMQEIYLLTTYFKNYFVDCNISVSELDKIVELNKVNNLNTGLVSFFSFSQKLEKHLNYNNIILLTLFVFDTHVRKDTLMYKVYNKLDNYKKIFFLIALLENILKIK